MGRYNQMAIYARNTVVTVTFNIFPVPVSIPFPAPISIPVPTPITIVGEPTDNTTPLRFKSTTCTLSRSSSRPSSNSRPSAYPCSYANHHYWRTHGRHHTLWFKYTNLPAPVPVHVPTSVPTPSLVNISGSPTNPNTPIYIHKGPCASIAISPDSAYTLTCTSVTET